MKETGVLPDGARVAVLPSAEAASRAVAESFAEQARRAVRESGRFAVALTGGGTPVAAYRMLAEAPLRERIPWDGVHLFWGDERCVPPGHPRSNFGMAHAAFVAQVPIPAANVHRIPGELPPEEGAARYAAALAEFFGPGVPRFDLVHLGIGGDGHVASLFPYAATPGERERTVRTALHRALGEWRITLTLPVLNAAARVEMLGFGPGKAEIVRTAARGPLDPFRIPAQLVRPVGAKLWVMDPAAAGRLGAAP